MLGATTKQYIILLLGLVVDQVLSFVYIIAWASLIWEIDNGLLLWFVMELKNKYI